GRNGTGGGRPNGATGRATQRLTGARTETVRASARARRVSRRGRRPTSGGATRAPQGERGRVQRLRLHRRVRTPQAQAGSGRRRAGRAGCRSAPARGRARLATGG